MKRFLAPLFLALSLGLPVHAATQVQKVHVRVVGSEDRPIAHAMVLIDDSPSNPTCLRDPEECDPAGEYGLTNDAGEIHFVDVPAEVTRIRVHVQARPEMEPVSEVFALKAGETTITFHLLLRAE